MNEQIKKEILSKIDIVDYIQQYLDLEKRGKQYFAICPFHSDNHPSLSVSREKQIFKCFTCGTGGDVISFIYKYNQLSNPNYTFRDALNEAARYANVEIHLNSPERQIDPELKKLYDINQEVLGIYKHYLNTELGIEAKQYLLKNRAFTEQTINEFDIGFAPNKSVLKQALARLNYTETDMLLAKVINDYGNDYFRNRIIFPIKDRLGHVVGFSGRILPGSLNEQEQAKYLNTPDTPIFTKGKNFYNLDKAKNVAIQQKKVYLVEGYTDAVSLSQAGLKNVVVQMGTALTTDQIRLLKNLFIYHGVQPIYIGDADVPGKKAVLKNAELLMKNDLQPRVVDLTIPGEKKVDPDSLIRENPALFKEKLNNPKSILAYKMDFYFAQRKQSGSLDKEEYVKKVLPAISKVSPLEQVALLSKLSDQTNYSVDVLKQQMQYDNLHLKVDQIRLEEKPAYEPDYYSTKKAIDTKKQFLTKGIEVQKRKDFRKDLKMLMADPKTVLLYGDQCISENALKLKYTELQGACLQFTTTILHSDKNDVQFYQEIRDQVVHSFAEEYSLDISNIECIAAVHHNTKCAHIHFNIWQKQPIKRILIADRLEKRINVTLNKKQPQHKQQFIQRMNKPLAI